MARRKTTEDFVKESILIHGDAFDYSKTAYTTAHTKVTITCNTHGDFEQRPNDHLRGRQGCPECIQEERQLRGVFERNGTKYFISRAQEIHGNRYDYQLVDYVNAHTPVTIICKKHGKFELTPNAHLRPRGCPVCGNELRAQQEKTKSASRAINIATIKHNFKYGYHHVDRTLGVSVPVEIVCPRHGSFMQPLNSHKKYGCKQCAAEDRFAGQYSLRAIKEKFPDTMGLFYCLRCSINEESFLKFGITAKSVNERYSNHSGIQFVVSMEFGTTLLHARELEIYLRNEYSNYRYFPTVKFPGYTECYDSTMLASLSSDPYFSSIIFC